MNFKNRINNKQLKNNITLSSGILAILIPTMINSLLFLLGDNLGLFPDNVINPETGQPMAIFEIIFASFGVAIAAVFVFNLFIKYIEHPVPRFRLLAIIVFLITLGEPFILKNAPIPMILLLLSMHITEAILIIGFLPSRRHN